jgi:hypothetical protein
MQQATFRCRIPKTEEELEKLEMPRVVQQPVPCFANND